MKRQYRTGFTLTELVVCVAIAAILTIIAVSAYIPYIRNSRRADAVNSLLSISLAEERYRSNNATYGTLAQVWGGITTSAGGYYTLAISNVAATTYTITATAIGDQANDSAGATACTPMVFSMSSGTITKTPAACWPP
ncbi:MAG: type IV pilin protein [Gammaproteobacteria bacterium]